ncbi:TPA: hypothetical protein ACH3X2_008236 [Trebouxia sp. C0005]
MSQALSLYEDLFDSSLFDNESYEVQDYRFSGQTVKLLCSASATTDYDLTGQILWPAASMLAGYLAANPAILQNCTCACELGAGLGLVGLLAAQACPVVLTDHNDVVLRVLGRNAELNQAHHSIRCLKLEWNSQDDIEQILQISPDHKPQSVACAVWSGIATFRRQTWLQVFAWLCIKSLLH